MILNDSFFGGGPLLGGSVIGGFTAYGLHDQRNPRKPREVVCDCYWQFFPFNASWRNVLEGRVAGSALPQTKRTDAAIPRSSEN